MTPGGNGEHSGGRPDDGARLPGAGGTPDPGTDGTSAPPPGAPDPGTDGTSAPRSGSPRSGSPHPGGTPAGPDRAPTSSWRRPALVWVAGVVSAALAGFGTNALTGWWQALVDPSPAVTAAPAPGPSSPGSSSPGATPPPGSPSTAASTPDDSPVRHRGTLTLLANQRADLDSRAADWGATSRQDPHADIWFDGVKTQLTGNVHSVLGVLPAGDAGDHEACARMSSLYGIPLTRSGMTGHRAVCVITDERHVAVLRITHVGSDRSGRPDEIVLDTVVYVPLHTT